jgi:hypothetical protein
MSYKPFPSKKKMQIRIEKQPPDHPSGHAITPYVDKYSVDNLNA